MLTNFTYLHRGDELVSPIESLDPSRYAWVAVYPLDLGKMSTLSFLRRRGMGQVDAAARVYRIRVFEVVKVLVDEDRSVCETDLVNREDLDVVGDKPLIIELKRMGVSLDQLTQPYKTDYPI